MLEPSLQPRYRVVLDPLIYVCVAVAIDGVRRRMARASNVNRAEIV
jgi:hypothetical protein